MSVLLPEHRERAFGAGQDYVQTAGGIYVPPWSEPALIAAAKPLGVGLFSGAGGFDLGMTYAGFHVVAASEWWVTAATTYLLNLGAPDTAVYVGRTAAEDATRSERRVFDEHAGEWITAARLFTLAGEERAPGSGWISSRSDHHVDECGQHMTVDPDDPDDNEEKLRDRRHWFHQTYCLGGRDRDADPCELFFLCDVHELTGEFILDALGVDSDAIGVVFGGPPCQGFSTANANRGPGDERNQLVFEFARLVVEIHPKALIMENVPGIVSMVTPEGIPVVDALTRILEDGGMGEYEALRRSLLASSGAGAAIRGAKGKPKRPGRGAQVDDDVEADEDELVGDAQLALEVPA